MNRRRFLQALFAIPMVVAPLLAPPSLAGPAPEARAAYLDFTSFTEALKQHYSEHITAQFHEFDQDPLLKLISERSTGSQYVVPVRYG